MTLNLTGTLNLATRSLQTSQSALGTISHNLANVNTQGFSRQTVQIGSETLSGFGNGSSIQAVTRQIDGLLLTRISNQTSVNSFNLEKQSIYNSIETVMGTGSNSLEGRVTDFFSQLNNLSNNTDSSAQKLNAVRSAELLADSIRSTYDDLTGLQVDINAALNSDISDTNSVIQSIHTLNTEISSTEIGTNSSANDLRDQRQQLVNKLSEKIGVVTREDANGQLLITTENGRNLVFQGGYAQFERQSGAGFYEDIVVRNVSEAGSSATTLLVNPNTLSSGSFKAQIDMRDSEIANIKAELDELAQNLMSEMNRLHSQGSSVPPPQTLTTNLRSPITNATSDLFSEIGASLQNNSFHISVVNPANGNVISSTATTGGGGPITLPGAGPFSLTDLETLINGNADVGGAITINVSTDANGDPYMEFDAGAGRAVVLENVSGDFLGTMVTNPFFTGSSADDIAVRSDIKASPELIATAQMRADGGLSFFDNQNALAMAELGSTDVSFSSAGRLSAQTDTLANYAIKIVSSVAVDMQDIDTRVEFSDAVLNDMQTRNSSVSGVNMDEELANLILFQNSFQASARIIQTVQEMFDELVNIV